ncbi:MAG TPA: PTS lactose/cellobiose transporter subunit IIA [Sporosarcina psychrophila]|uniref:PTS lactose/cellobiose transporter subunit IIA n=1 Tax=Sporosarcina psychrophila TaxID=1476 RepID=A0A921KF43_SPOPS|nr:PTS lactose/cellobiose transporter subunit IIA [Sporosarcina psychrophila]
MEEYYTAAFHIISNVGTAKSLTIEAIQAAKENQFSLVDKKIEEASKLFAEGHKGHAEFIKRESAGEELKYSLMFMHAEDQLMNTETIMLLAKEIIDLYKNRGGENG